MDGCREICQRQTEMEKACGPMFQQKLEELRSKVRSAITAFFHLSVTQQNLRLIFMGQMPVSKPKFT